MFPNPVSWHGMMVANSVVLTIIAASPHVCAEITPAAVIQEMNRAADRQMANLEGLPATDAGKTILLLGLSGLHEVGGEAKHRTAWETFTKHAASGVEGDSRIQALIEAYRADQDISRLGPAFSRFDEVQKAASEGGTKSLSGGSFVWSRSDALLTSPPLWAEFSRITGNPKFLDWADREWWTTTDVLYSPHHGLFYQDNGAFKKRTAGGHGVFSSYTNGAALAGITRMLDHLPEDHPSRGKYLAQYGDMTSSLLKLQNADGAWGENLLTPGGSKADAAGTALVIHGMAWGMNRGLLPETEYRPAITKGYSVLVKSIQASGEGSVSPAVGAFLLAGAEIVRGLDPSKGGASLTAFKNGESSGKFLRSKPRAHARHVPERADDFAWENDFVAFRTYGPALRPGPENSGIDCWFKRVPYPVMDKWYIEDVTKLPPADIAKSYHEDHGEGYDAYKVGDSRGCGGISVWMDGKLHNSDTYVSYTMIENNPERVMFDLHYASDLKGKVLRETKRITLIMGQRFFQSDSRFTLDGEPAADLEVAIGLMPQSKDAKPVFDAASGTLSIWEPFDGHGLGTAVAIDPERVTGMKIHVDGAGQKQALCLAKTDATGTIRWFSGFAWEGQGSITSGGQWEEHLKAFAAEFGKTPYAVFSGETELRVHGLPIPGTAAAPAGE